MASGIFRPRRGKRSTAISKGIVLKRGEIFFEVPDSGVGTGAGKIVMGDGTTAYEDLPYYNEGGSGAGTVQSVNHVMPDASGNVNLTQVPLAENLIADDNIVQNDAYIFRTAGGGADIHSGDADLDIIKGNCTVSGGVISIATPSAFRSIGLNQFDKASMILTDYTITSSGAVTAQVGSYVCYIHAVGGLDTGYNIYEPNGTIARVGWFDSIPTASTTGIYVSADGVHVTSIINDSTDSVVVNAEDGYICVACTNINSLTVHPKWSGIADSETAEYTAYTINVPLVDAENTSLPTASYGFPSVNDVRDEINFNLRTYTQRIGHYVYSAANLATVEAMGVDYIYDSAHIFYVLPNPIVYKLNVAVTSHYIVNDFGIEEFVGTSVPVYATTVYGENLKDKLRRDVVTISEQSLSANQRQQVRTNLDAAQDHLVFTEAEDTDNYTLLNTIVSGNPMNTLFGANKRLLRRLTDQTASKVSSVNSQLPDMNGNVELTRVPLADNLYSPDNNENYEGYIYRTSGGHSDLTSGPAQLSFIRGNMVVKDRVQESLTAGYTSSHTPEPEEEYEYPSVNITAATWRTSPLGSASGTYTFTYDGSNWTYNSSAVDLATYGMEVTGTVSENDFITVIYVKAEQGTLCTIKPTSFVAIELNQFKSDNVLSGYTIDASGVIVAQSGSYVAYCKAPYSDSEGYIAYDSNASITRMGYITTVPAAGSTVSLTGQALGSSISTYTVPDTSVGYDTGYVCVACTNITKLCVHPRWSGGNDTTYADYTASTIAMPTKDANNNDLPYVSYGLPAIQSVADEINFDLKQYIQRIGHYAYTDANLATVQALGVPYDYDANHIFYVLQSPITLNLNSSVSGTYTVNDYGTEHFEYSIGVGSEAGILLFGDHLYGQNLRDKLRRDVLTISAQTLSAAEQSQVLTNIGAASAASVTQLNNETIKYRFLGEVPGGGSKNSLVNNILEACYNIEPGVYNIAGVSGSGYASGHHFCGMLEVLYSRYFYYIMVDLFGEDLVIAKYFNGTVTYDNLSEFKTYYSQFFKHLPYIRASDLGVGTNAEAYLQALITYYHNNGYFNDNEADRTIYFAVTEPNYDTFIIGHVYGNSVATTYSNWVHYSIIEAEDQASFGFNGGTYFYRPYSLRLSQKANAKEITVPSTSTNLTDFLKSLGSSIYNSVGGYSYTHGMAYVTWDGHNTYITLYQTYGYNILMALFSSEYSYIALYAADSATLLSKKSINTTDI